MEHARIPQVYPDGLASVYLKLANLHRIGAFTDENGNGAYDTGEPLGLEMGSGEQWNRECTYFKAIDGSDPVTKSPAGASCTKAHCTMETPLGKMAARVTFRLKDDEWKMVDN